MGVLWNPKQDQFLFDVQLLVKYLIRIEATKRNIIQSAARIYDPLGICLRSQFAYQKLCRAKLGWDDVLTAELNRQWQSLVSNFSVASAVVTIPCHLPGLREFVSLLSLVGFCDASKDAYAVVVYLKSETHEGTSM